MLSVGDKLPEFNLKAVTSLEKGKEFKQITNKDFTGKWKVVFFWPKDFTFVCPTEIAEFGKKNKEFTERDAQVLGVSVDSEYVHLAWRNQHPDLKNLPFPMLADLKRELSNNLGVLHKDGVPLRATFIVDPDGVIRFVSVNDLSVGRNVDEVLRTLDALQTDELCPCNWQKGEKTSVVIAALEQLREQLPEPARDLKLNLQAVLEPSSGAILSAAQRWGVAVASAIAARQPALRDAILAEAALHAPREVLEDAQAAAALMAMNNVFYRFRHIIEKASYEEKPARLRMNRLVKPAASKVDFELYCLAVSAIHNCVACVKAHEKAVLEGGLTEDHVFEAIRIAAVMNGAGLGLELGELATVDAASVG